MSASGQLVGPARVGRLDTVAGWRREIGRVYRAMKRGDIAPSDGTKLAFVADLGARLCKVEQELAELTQLRQHIARLEGRGEVTGLLESLPSVDGGSEL